MEKVVPRTTLLTEQSIVIHSPVTEVFSFISNMENFKRWFPEVLEIVSENDMEHGKVGKTYLESVNLPPHGEQKLTIEVKSVVEPELYVTESQYEPLLPRMTIRLRKENENMTELTWKMECRNPDEDFVINELPTFVSIINTRASSGLKKLKEIIER